tara:strand:- start:3757 stop:5469 length:1713 start_codon:yes stop_codon:yes gene_type:complete
VQGELKRDINQLNNPQDTVDFKNIISFFIRNKFFIGIFTFLGIIIGSINAYSQNKIWQGNFKIVLESNNDSPLSLDKENVSSALDILNIGSSSSQLKTEIEILKSPSVLMDTFKFVKSKKIESNDRSYSNKSFTSWANNSLDFDLEYGTRILDIKYRDTDKQIIIPVLKRISNTYQDYSGKERLRKVNLGLDFFRNQVEIFKEKSEKSFIESQLFGIKHKIIDLSSTKSDGQLILSTDIEEIQKKSRDEINIINNQLAILDNIKDKDQLISLASNIGNISEDSLVKQLNDLSQELVNLKTIYTDSDDLIKEKNSEKQLLLNLLSAKIENELIIQKKVSESNLENASRPDDILIKFKELIIIADKDRKTLSKLEDNFRFLLVEQAKFNDPWKLITKPTLLLQPIGPSRLKIIALGLIFGLFAGLIIAFIKEKRKDLIYNRKYLEYITGQNILSEISFLDKNSLKISLNIFCKGNLEKTNDSFLLLATEEIDNSQLKILADYLKANCKNKEVLVSKEIDKALNFKKIFFITSLGFSKVSNLLTMIKTLNFKREDHYGLLLFTENSSNNFISD